MLTRSSFALAWWSKWPSCKLDLEIIKTNILARFMMSTAKMWPLECWQGFPLNGHDDLVFYPKWPSFNRAIFMITSKMWPLEWPKWPSFKLDLEIMKMNSLHNIHDDFFKNETTGVLTRFSFDLAWWPSFYPKWPSFEPDPEIIHKHFEQNKCWLCHKCDL